MPPPLARGHVALSMCSPRSRAPFRDCEVAIEPLKSLMTDEAHEWLAALPEFLKPIAVAARKIAAAGAWIDHSSGAFLAGYRPDLGTHAYDVMIFPPLPPAALESYQQVNDFLLPRVLTDILAHLNGCYLRELKLYGAPPSMTRDPPLLDRNRRSPLDISTGRYWRYSYAPAPVQNVLFASRVVGDHGLIGYFISPAGQVIGRGNGSPTVEQQSGPWTNITEWLASMLDQPRSLN